MPGFDTGSTLADRMRAHAGDARHLYGELIRAMADDWENGGPVRRICAGWEDAPQGAVVQLRLLAGLFRIVLTGRAPDLEPFYPCASAERRRRTPPGRLCAASSRRMSTSCTRRCETAPQTNEVGRSTALLVGLFEAVRRSGRRRVRLRTWCQRRAEPAGRQVPLRGADVAVRSGRFTPGAPRRSRRRDRAAAVRDRGPAGMRPRTGRSVDASGPAAAAVVHLAVPRRAAPAADRCALGRIRSSRRRRPGASGRVAGTRADQADGRRHADGGVAVDHPTVLATGETERVRAAIHAARPDRLVAHVAMEYPADDDPTAMLTLSGLPGDALVTLARVGDHGRPVTLLATA